LPKVDAVDSARNGVTRRDTEYDGLIQDFVPLPEVGRVPPIHANTLLKGERFLIHSGGNVNVSFPLGDRRSECCRNRQHRLVNCPCGSVVTIFRYKDSVSKLPIDAITIGINRRYANAEIWEVYSTAVCTFTAVGRVFIHIKELIIAG